MTCHCKPLLFLLRQSVRVAQITLPTGIKSGVSGGHGFIQHRLLSSAVRDIRIKRIFEKQTLLKSSTLHFSTKPPVEDEYLPLPDYHDDADFQKKEVYIIQVKGLPWACTAQDLLQFFSDCRIRGGLKGIHLTTDRSGRASGQAFIEVEHEEDVGKALEKHRQYLGPRYVEVYEVTNSDAEAILKKSAEVGQSSDTVVRLRGLPFSASEADIVKFFSGLDIVKNGITIVTNNRGRTTGAAYVEFASQEAFEEALTRNKELIGHRYIEVFPSQRDEIHSSWKTRSKSGLQSSPPAPRRTTSRNESHMSSSLPPHYVHMRGLPFGVSGEEIAKFFSPLLVSKVLIEFGSNGKPSGEADVYFSRHQEAVDAMSRDRMNIGERYIELFLNSEPDSEM